MLAKRFIGHDNSWKRLPTWSEGIKSVPEYVNTFQRADDRFSFLFMFAYSTDQYASENCIVTLKTQIHTALVEKPLTSINMTWIGYDIRMLRGEQLKLYFYNLIEFFAFCNQYMIQQITGNRLKQ